MTQEYEFDEVRKLSAEIVSLIDPSVSSPSHIQTISQRFIESLQKGDIHMAKVCLYCICNALFVFGRELEQYGGIIQAIPYIMDVLAVNIASAESTTEGKLSITSANK